MIEVYNFIIAIYATLIVGAGYVGLWVKYKFSDQKNKGHHTLKGVVCKVLCF